MIIETFFNPLCSTPKEKGECMVSLKRALVLCKEEGKWIRHWSWRGDQYIKWDSKNFIWSGEGQRVNLNKIPKKTGYGHYVSKLHNHTDF